MNSKIISRGIASLVLLASGLTYRSLNSNNFPESPKPVEQKVLRIGIGADPVLDPQLASGSSSRQVLKGISEGLLVEEPQYLRNKTTNQPLPGLAKSWDVSNDGLKYTFHLRENLVWSDGDPITADDFIESFQRLLSPKLAAPNRTLIYDVVGAKDFAEGKLFDFSKTGFHKKDDLTLEIILERPVAHFLDMIANNYALNPVPIHVIKQNGEVDSRSNTWAKKLPLVSHGPFVLKSSKLDDRLIAEKSQTYWDKNNVALNSVVFLPVDSADVEERSYRTNQLDITFTFPLNKIPVYKKDWPTHLSMGPYASKYLYFVNVRDPALSDPAIRRALSHSINREGIVKILGAGQVATTTFAYRGLDDYVPAQKEAKTHLQSQNLNGAKQLLINAGYVGGTNFPEFELSVNNVGVNPIIAEVVKEDWRKNLGLNVSVVKTESKVHYTNQRQGKFQISRGGWTVDYPSQLSFYEILTSTSPNNPTGWKSKDYDELYSQALNAKTVAQRHIAFNRMESIIQEQVPIIVVYNMSQYRAIDPRIIGFYPNATDSHPLKFVKFNPGSPARPK